MKSKAITQAEYGAFQEAYDFFNAELFKNALPNVLITLQRHARARGYFHAERFSARGANGKAHELALNPDTFTDRTDEEILSTLVHEMAHVWQQECGAPPRRCYHDKEWAAKMKAVGLHPSSTGEPGGKETGQSMTHYIIAGGVYAQAYAKLKAAGFKLQWESPAGNGNGAGKSKDSSKTKYSCPDCEQNAWAKPGAMLICGECYEEGSEPVVMAPAA
jgi:predicted SprT family Zn-dependent metalloprotease